MDEVHLWPEIVREPTQEQRIDSVESELVRVYADRASVPRDTWLQLISSASRHIDVLVFAGRPDKPLHRARAAEQDLRKPLAGKQVVSGSVSYRPDTPIMHTRTFAA